MSSKILAICDTEDTYADLLTKQLLRIPGNRMEIRKFTEVDKLKIFSKDKIITYLLLAEKYKEIEGEIEYLSCYYLTDQRDSCDRKIKDDFNQQYLYRYQSANAIYERISGQVAVDKEMLDRREVEPQFSYIGVFNPVRRCGQTTFARALAKHLGKGAGKVLYINMDEISESVDNLYDPQNIVDGEGCLTDLIYYVKQSPEKVIDQIRKLVYKGEFYDTIAPVEIFTELGKVSQEEWLELMEVLKDTGYHTIVLDMDSSIHGYLELLEKCSHVYVPHIKNEHNSAKEYSFNQALKILGRNQLLIKMEGVTVPKYKSDIFESVVIDMPSILG